MTDTQQHFQKIDLLRQNSSNLIGNTHQKQNNVSPLDRQRSQTPISRLNLKNMPSNEHESKSKVPTKELSRYNSNPHLKEVSEQNSNPNSILDKHSVQSKQSTSKPGSKVQ